MAATLLIVAAAAEAGPALAVSVPIRLNDARQVFLQARINDSDPIWCNLDSGGGDRLYLDRARAAVMGIQPTTTGRSAGPGDTKMAVDLRAEVTVEIAGIKLANQPVLLQSRPYADFSCVIGQTIFRQSIVEVDYETPAIRIHNPGQFAYSGPGKAVPFVFDGGNPFVTATVVAPNGKPFAAKVAVDTGGGPSVVMLSKRFVDQHELLNQNLALTPEPKFGMAGQQSKVVSARVEKFGVGSFDLAQPIVHLWQVDGFGGSGGPDGLLCNGFLSRFKLFFDYPNQKLILEPNARFRQ